MQDAACHNIFNSWKMGSERAWVRRMSSRIHEDVQRYHEINNRSDVADEDSSGLIDVKTADLDDAIEHLENDDEPLFAVSSSKDSGEMAGWICIYEADPKASDLIEDENIKKSLIARPTWEVSYASYRPSLKDNPEAYRGLISSGLRQLCYQIGQELVTATGKLGAKDKWPPKINFVAYTLPANKASERVLVAAGFQMVCQARYDKDEEEPDNFWVLNWDKLKEILIAKNALQDNKFSTNAPTNNFIKFNLFHTQNK